MRERNGFKAGGRGVDKQRAAGEKLKSCFDKQAGSANENQAGQSVLPPTDGLNQHLSGQQCEHGRIETAEPPVVLQIRQKAPGRAGNQYRSAQDRQSGSARRLSQAHQAQGNKSRPIPYPMVKVPVGQVAGQQPPPLSIFNRGPIVLPAERERGAQQQGQGENCQAS